MSDDEIDYYKRVIAGDLPAAFPRRGHLDASEKYDDMDSLRSVVDECLSRLAAGIEQLRAEGDTGEDEPGEPNHA